MRKAADANCIARALHVLTADLPELPRYGKVTIAFALYSVFVPTVSLDVLLVGLAARFAQIVGGLCDALGDYEARERTAGPFVFEIRQLLRRRLDRFVALAARFYAGTLRAARPATGARAPSEPADRERYWDPMPRDRAWLWRLVPRVSVYLGLFEGLLADPDMAALLAAAPQAGRLLRPLWWIVSPDPLPEALRRRPPPAAASASPASSGVPPCASSGVPPRDRPQSLSAEPPRLKRSRTRLVRPAYDLSNLK